MLFRQDPPYPSSLANPVLFSSSTITTKYYSSSREGLIRKKKEITQNLFVFDDDSAQVDEIQNKKRANEVCIDH